MKMRRYLALFLVVCLAMPFLLPILAEAEGDGIRLEVNGEERLLSVTPYQNDLGVMAGAEELMEACGLTCAFDPEKKTLTVTEEGAENVVLMHGATAYYRGEERVTIAEPYFYVENDLPMIEVGFFGELFGFSYHYDEEARVLHLTPSHQEETDPAEEATEEPTETPSELPELPELGPDAIPLTGRLTRADAGEALSVKLVLWQSVKRGDKYEPNYPEFGEKYELGTVRFDENETTATYAVDLSQYRSPAYPDLSLYYEAPELGEMGYADRFGGTTAFFEPETQPIGEDYYDNGRVYTMSAQRTASADLMIGYGSGLTLFLTPEDETVPAEEELDFYAVPYVFGITNDGRRTYTLTEDRIPLGRASFTPGEPTAVFTVDTAAYDSGNSDGFAVFYESSEAGSHIADQGFIASSGNVRIVKDSETLSVARFRWGESVRMALTLPVNAKSGMTEDGVEWELGDDGLLTVRQTDEVPEEASSWSEYRDRIREVRVEEGMTEIKNGAFQNCTRLEKVTLPEGLVSIGASAFSGCSALSEMSLPASVRAVYDYAFAETALSREILPEGVEYLGWKVFSAPVVTQGFVGEKANWILYEDGTLKIYGQGFMYGFSEAPWGAYRSMIREVWVGEGVLNIAGGLFENTPNLEKIWLSHRLERIDMNAFKGCDALRDVWYEYGAEEWNNLSVKSGNEALLGATLHFGFHPAASPIPSDGEDGEPTEPPTEAPATEPQIVESGMAGRNITWMLDDAGVLTVSGSGDIPDYYEDEVSPFTSIRSNITAIKLCEGVTGIGNCTFRRCDRLKEVYLPTSCTRIGAMAFRDCVRLERVFAQEGLERIEEYAFTGCNGLDPIALPASVTDVHPYAFPIPGEKSGGRCSDTVRWTLSTDNVMTFHGSGTLPSYPFVAPWEPYRQTVTEVVIEEGITKIDDESFHEFTGLTTVTLPKSLKSIGRQAFRNCSALQTVSYAGSAGDWAKVSVSDNNNRQLTNADFYFDGVPIGTHVTEGKCGDALTWSLNDGVLQISGSGAMWDFTDINKTPWAHEIDNVRKVMISDGVTTIGAYAFGMCRYLTELKLPSALCEVHSHAFYGCYRVQGVALPDSVRIIGDEAFHSCHAPIPKLPASLQSVGDYAFASCSGLTATSLPSGLQMIGDYAFSSCGGLTTLSLPSGLQVIGEGAFWGCGLTHLRVPDSVHYIGESAFASCRNLEEITLPARMNSLNEYTFANCEKLQSVILPDGIMSLPRYLFQGCSSLTSVFIPVTVKQIMQYSFSGCDALEEIYYGGTKANWTGVYRYKPQGGAFENAKINYADVSGTVPGTGITWSLKDRVLQISGSGAIPADSETARLPWKPYQSGIDRIEIGEGVTAIGADAFFGMGKLSEVSLPKSLMRIEENVFPVSDEQNIILSFGGSEAAWQALFPNGIESPAFRVSVCTFGEGDTQKRVRGICGTDITWTVYNDTDMIVDGTGDIKNFAGTTGAPWSGSAMTVESLTVKEGITGIGDCGFAGFRKIRTLRLPESVTRIGENAFWCCSDLEEITLPQRLRSIGAQAFIGCVNLKQVVLPACVTQIPAALFKNCTSLQSVFIPDTVTEIEERAFYNCEALSDVYYGGSADGWAKIHIDRENDLGSVTIHYGAEGLPKTELLTTELLPGDADGDGMVGAKDVTVLRRTIATGKAAVDLNGDGKTDAKDLTILRRMVANR